MEIIKKHIIETFVNIEELEETIKKYSKDGFKLINIETSRLSVFSNGKSEFIEYRFLLKFELEEKETD